VANWWARTSSPTCSRTGAVVVEQLLTAGPDYSAVNWSEVAQKVRTAGGDWPLAAALLSSYGLRVRDATADDAERAAALWCRGRGSRSRTGSASRWAIGWTQHLGREQGDRRARCFGPPR